MSIFTTRDEQVSLSSIIHDYAHAFASDPDDIDLRRHRITAWLARHDHTIAQTVGAQAWAEGVIYGMNAVLSASNDARVDPLLENPYRDEEEGS